MLNDYAIEQSTAYKILLNSVKTNKLSHAYLFETNNYQKGFDMALAFGKCLLCPNNFVNNEKCGICYQCKNIDEHDYPDLRIIDSDGLWIKKEQLDNLQKEFSKKSINGGNQVYIINHAEKLNAQAANSILKFLEEPEPNIVAILVTNNKYSLLDTIISRCQIISLKDSSFDVSTMSTIENIAYHLFNNRDEIDNFVQDKQNETIMNKVIEFITYYEKNGLATILFTNRLWHSVIKEKENIINGFSIMLLFYKDVLSYKVKGNTEIFESNSEMEYIKNSNTDKQLCDKINVILRNKEKIKYNINTSLLIDNLIIEMEKIK